MGDVIQKEHKTTRESPKQGYKDGESSREDVRGVAEVSWFVRFREGETEGPTASSQGQALVSAYSDRNQGNSMKLLKGSSGWISGKDTSPEGSQALEQAPHGNGCGSKLPEFKEHLGNALRHII